MVEEFKRKKIVVNDKHVATNT